MLQMYVIAFEALTSNADFKHFEVNVSKKFRRRHGIIEHTTFTI